MACTTRHTYQVLTKRPQRMLEYFESRCSDEESTLTGWPEKIDPLAVWPQWTPCAAGKPGYDNCGPAWPLANVWLGVSVEDQASANERVPRLLEAPAGVRFVSCEPLLGPLDLCAVETTGREIWNALDREEAREAVAERACGATLDWVIAGGESGPQARPMHPAWARSLRDQCALHRVPYFFKQWGEWLPLDSAADGKFVRVGKKLAGRLLDGRTHDEYPASGAAGAA